MSIWQRTCRRIICRTQELKDKIAHPPVFHCILHGLKYLSKETEISSANYKLHELTVSTLGRYIVTLRGPFISENWEGRKFQK